MVEGKPNEESVKVANAETESLTETNNIPTSETVEESHSHTHSNKLKMNPSPWCNPPPPGYDMDEEESKTSNVSSSKSVTGIDQIDPYIKNPEYVKYKRSATSRRSRSRSNDHNRSKSRSRERERRRRHRSSRSRSRTRHRRSRSRTRRHRRVSPAISSKSRSKSPSQSRNRHKHKRSRKSRRSRSRSRSHERRRQERKYYPDAPRRGDPVQYQQEDNGNGNEADEDEVDTKENAFKNDGSFLEMFKKMQEEKQKAEEIKQEAVAAPAASTSEVKRLLPAFGKRRGGRVLKTGMVEKTKAVEDDELANATDPWSIYLKEVKRYKEACCDDDSKTRPLVK